MSVPRSDGMGTFRVEVTLKNVHESARRQTLSLLVDTGATYTTLPRTVAESLGCSPIGTRRVLLANGREEEWPIGLVLMTLENQELPTVCLIGPNGGPALLGAVTLEEFALSVDPVARRLVPVRSYLTRSSPQLSLPAGRVVGRHIAVGWKCVVHCTTCDLPSPSGWTPTWKSFLTDSANKPVGPVANLFVMPSGGS